MEAWYNDDEIEIYSKRDIILEAMDDLQSQGQYETPTDLYLDITKHIAKQGYPFDIHITDVAFIVETFVV